MNQNTRVKKSKRNTTRSSAPVRQIPGAQTPVNTIPVERPSTYTSLNSRNARPSFSYPDEPQAFPLHSSATRILSEQTSYAQRKDIDLFTPRMTASYASKTHETLGQARRNGREPQKNAPRISSSYTKLSDAAFTPTDENEAYAREITARRREERRRAKEQARLEEEQRIRAEEERIRLEEESRARAEATQRARIESERRARFESEQKIRAESERRAHAEATQRARIESEQRAHAKAAQRARIESERRARAESERKIRTESEQKTRTESEQKTRTESEQKIRAESERKSRTDRESAADYRPEAKHRRKKKDSPPKQSASKNTAQIPAYLKEPQPSQAFHEIPVPVSRKKKRKKHASEPQLSDHQPLLDYSEESNTPEAAPNAPSAVANVASSAVSPSDSGAAEGTVSKTTGLIRIPAQVQKQKETMTDLQDVIPVKEGTGDTRPNAIKKERESRRKRDERLTYMLVAFAIIFIVSGFFLVRIFWRYQKASSEYSALQKDYVEIPDDADAPVDSNTYQAPPYPELKINFPSLYAINNDCLGWIYIPGCKISYPLVKGTDNDYYLSHTFEKKSSSNGAIFMDYQDSSDLSSFNTFIYGHDMRDGSMFASLFKYGTTADLIGSYPYFFIYLTNGNVMKYQICSFYTSDGNSDSYLRVDTTEQKASYVAMILAKSTLIKSETSTGTHLATADDTFVTLSTCHGSGQRFLVHGYLTAIYNTVTGSVNELYSSK